MTTSCFRSAMRCRISITAMRDCICRVRTKKNRRNLCARSAKGAPMVCFQCADDTVYQEVYRLLIEEQGIFAYLPESETTAAYLDSDRERTFYFWFTEVS